MKLMSLLTTATLVLTVFSVPVFAEEGAGQNVSAPSESSYLFLDEDINVTSIESECHDVEVISGENETLIDYIVPTPDPNFEEIILEEYIQRINDGEIVLPNESYSPRGRIMCIH